MKNEDAVDREVLDGEPPRRFPNLLQIAWRHKTLMVLGMVVGLVIGSFYYSQKSPVYSSTAQVLVVKKRPDAVPVPGIDVNPAYYDDYLTTHQAIIRSPVVIGQAVTKHELQSLPCFAGQGDPVMQIKQALGVAKEKDSGSTSGNVLEFSFRASNPEDSQAVLAAIIDSYKDFLDKTYGNVSTDTVELITQAANDLRKELSAQQTAYEDFRRKSPLMYKGKESINLAQEENTELLAQRSKLRIRLAELQPRLTAIETALKDGRRSAALVALISASANQVGLESRKLTSGMNLEDIIVPNLLEEKGNRFQGLGPNHPAVKAYQKQIELTRRFFPHELGEDSKTAGGPAKQETGIDGMMPFLRSLNQEIGENKLHLYIDALRLELDGLRAAEKQLTEMLEGVQRTARKISDDELQDEIFRKDLSQTEAHYDAAIKRLAEVNLIKGLGGYDTRVISPPTGGLCVEPNPLLVFPIAAMLGLLSGFGLSYLAEVSDKSFHTPEEIRSRLGLPVLGSVPRFRRAKVAAGSEAGDKLALDAMICSHYRAKSHEAEAYRGVRTALYFSTRGQGHKVIQITSPEAEDGKSTLAANLAVSIAQSGKSVLLIDADLRKPRIHKLFGLSSAVGLVSVLQGEAEAVEAIHHTVLPNLSVLPCGPVPLNAADLLTSRRFEELLPYIRDQFDFVLLDTPPVLAVSDPCAVAARVDGVVLTIRLSKRAGPAAEKAKDLLETLGAKLLGVVVNDLSRQPRFGAPSYDHYYHDGYGYSGKNGQGNSEVVNTNGGQPNG